MASIRPLPAKLQEKAIKELDEQPDRVEEDLQHIEQWIKKQPHLSVREGRQFLINFLRSTKFKLERTKEKLDFFYTMKSIAAEYCVNKDPFLPEVAAVLREGVHVPITKTTSKAAFPTIFITNWKRAANMHFTDIFKAALIYMDLLLKDEDNTSISGVCFIQDMQDFPFHCVKQLTPAICKKAAVSMQSAYPIRVKGLYFFNAPKMYEVFVKLFVPFFSEKVRNRIKVFAEGELDKMYELIPQKLLPKDFGGEAESMKHIKAEWCEKINNNREWYLEDDMYVSDESKRTEDSKMSQDIFGVDGSFRQLNID